MAQHFEFNSFYKVSASDTLAIDEWSAQFASCAGISEADAKSCAKNLNQDTSFIESLTGQQILNGSSYFLPDADLFDLTGFQSKRVRANVAFTTIYRGDTLSGIANWCGKSYRTLFSYNDGGANRWVGSSCNDIERNGWLALEELPEVEEIEGYADDAAILPASRNWDRSTEVFANTTTPTPIYTPRQFVVVDDNAALKRWALALNHERLQHYGLRTSMGNETYAHLLSIAGLDDRGLFLSSTPLARVQVFSGVVLAAWDALSPAEKKDVNVQRDFNDFVKKQLAVMLREMQPRERALVSQYNTPSVIEKALVVSLYNIMGIYNDVNFDAKVRSDFMQTKAFTIFNIPRIWENPKVDADSANYLNSTFDQLVKSKFATVYAENVIAFKLPRVIQNSDMPSDITFVGGTSLLGLYDAGRCLNEPIADMTCSQAAIAEFTEKKAKAMGRFERIITNQGMQNGVDFSNVAIFDRNKFIQTKNSVRDESGYMTQDSVETPTSVKNDSENLRVDTVIGKGNTRDRESVGSNGSVSTGAA